MTQGWQPIETAPRDGTVILLPDDVRARWRSGVWDLLEPKPSVEGLSPTHWRHTDGESTNGKEG